MKTLTTIGNLILKGAVLSLFVLGLTCFMLMNTLAAAASIDEASLSETHEKLDLKLAAGSYWHSTSSVNMTTAATPFAYQYMGTQVKFTKAQLPEGSVIYLDSGYQYRPEGWQTATEKNTNDRPANVKDSCVLVDAEWWDNYTLRAFNVQNTESAKKYTVDGTTYTWNLNENFEAAKDALRIYVPKAQEIELEFSLGYYNSTTSSNLVTTGDLAKKFVATQILTKEQLPVGSVIEIDSGYGYRPEGWVDLNTKNDSTTRPKNVSTSVVEVTEEWWGDFNYRAFNIYTSPQADISENYLDVASHFKIYAPGSYVPPEEDEEEEETQVGGTVTIPEDDSVIRVLAIGNSFSNDAMHYTHTLAAASGINAEFYSLYYGGCTIEKHHTFYTSNSPEYVLYKNSKVMTSEKVTMKTVLEAAQFDYITFQQGSWASDDYSTYALLDELMAIVREYQPDAEFMIHQTWGYCLERSLKKKYNTSAEMFAAVESCYNSAASDNGNLKIIKSGRAVETAKTLFNFTDDYGNTDSMYSDLNSHLANFGDYLAGCVWIETIFGKDMRETVCDVSGMDCEYVLCEIAHQTVNGTDGAELILNENSSIPENVVMKNAAEHGFDYDGRGKITIIGTTDNKPVRVVWQSLDGTIPSLGNLPAGEYILKIEKNGYAAYTSKAFTVEKDVDFALPEINLLGGDIKESTSDFCGDGTVDIDDFTRVLRGFSKDTSEEIRTIVDINGDGYVNVTDLNYIKTNFGK